MTEEIAIRHTVTEASNAVASGQPGSTVDARGGAERKDRKPMISWAALLDEAVTKPGYIHQAYSRFHQFSLGNQLLVLFQCLDRSIPLGPLASYTKWKQLGRQVQRGSKAITLCMPVTCNRKRTVKKNDGTEQEEEFSFTHFVYRAHWFTLGQTEGKEYQAPAIPEWNEEKALAALKIERIPFNHLDGNAQGFARKRGVAISPVAFAPHLTLFHELAHVADR